MNEFPLAMNGQNGYEMVQLQGMMNGMSPTPSPPLPPGHTYQGPVMVHTTNGVLAGIHHGLYVPPQTLAVAHPTMAQFPTLPYNSVVAQGGGGQRMAMTPPPTLSMVHHQAMKHSMYNYPCIPAHRICEPSPLSGDFTANDQELPYDTQNIGIPIGTKPADDNNQNCDDSSTQDSQVQTEKIGGARELFRCILKDKGMLEILMKTDKDLLHTIAEYVVEDSK